MAHLQCSSIGLLPSDEQCAFAMENCFSDAVLDPFWLFYCGSSSSSIRNWIIVPTLGLVLVAVFTCMALVASEGMVPSLSLLSRLLCIPPALAGLTLVAFGNGAPDIISTYTSLVTHNSGMALGELMGAAFFVNCVVLGVVFIFSPFDIIEDNTSSVTIDDVDEQESMNLVKFNSKAMFVRDVCFFILALVVLLVCLSDNVLTRFEMGLMVIIYVTYVITILSWQWFVESKLNKYRITSRIRNFFNDETPLDLGYDGDIVELEDSYSFNPMVFKSLELATIMGNLHQHRSLRLFLNDIPMINDALGDENIEIVRNDLPVEVQLPEPTFFNTAIYYFTLPLNLLFTYSIPNLENENEFDAPQKPSVERLTQLLTSLLVSPAVTILVAFPFSNWIWISILLLLTEPCAYLLYYHVVKSPKPHHMAKLAITILGFLTSISWMSVLATQVISTLSFFSNLSKFRPSLLGLTVFAVGNSTSDLIFCLVISKMGYPLMALASCIGGPMLNILLGLGISGLVSGQTDVPIPMTGSVTIVGVSLVFILVVVFLIMIPFLGWRAQPKLGYIMLSLWVIVLTFVLVLESILV